MQCHSRRMHISKRSVATIRNIVLYLDLFAKDGPGVHEYFRSFGMDFEVAERLYIIFTTTFCISVQNGMGNGVRLEYHVGAEYVRKDNDRRCASDGAVQYIGA